jgi:hypothetical protein
VGEAHSVLITAILLPQRQSCYWGKIMSLRISPISGSPTCVWPLRNRDPPAKISRPTYTYIQHNADRGAHLATHWTRLEPRNAGLESGIIVVSSGLRFCLNRLLCFPKGDGWILWTVNYFSLWEYYRALPTWLGQDTSKWAKFTDCLPLSLFQMETGGRFGLCQTRICLIYQNHTCISVIVRTSISLTVDIWQLSPFNLTPYSWCW